MIFPTEPLVTAFKGKGPTALLKRAWMIGKRYGLTAAKMARSLEQLSQLLETFGCRATLPVTAVALARNSRVIQEYQARGIEFAVHGYTHIDYSQLAPQEQLAHVRRAHETFAKTGVQAVGFRSPYLRREAHLNSALEAAGFAYVSNQPVMWDVLDADALTPANYGGYEQAITFYEPWYASERPSLPRLGNHLVEIPVALPDDEILLDRLDGETRGLVEKAWRRILSETYQRGELFTIQLHPERMALCANGLSSVLAEARTLTPAVWLARLDEIATWWQARAGATVEITDTDGGGFRVAIAAPGSATVLVRAAEVDVPTVSWADSYQQAEATTFTVVAPSRPFIGVSPDASPKLGNFLRQQGYIIEINRESHRYSYYFDQAEFTAEQERPLLAQIEQVDRPLVRLGRWPNGARSALAVTGDIDALSLWDFGLRFFGA